MTLDGDRIVACAIVFGTQVWCGEPFKDRHSDIIHRRFSVTGLRGSGEQGFLTDKGQFLGRWHALVIAKKAGQLKAEPHIVDELISEDLW